MNASFFVYLFGSCIGIAIVALLLLIFRVQDRKAPWRNPLMLFVVCTFLLGLLYFGERFYTGNFEVKGGWPAFVRAIDLILASAQMIVWAWYLREEAGLTDRRISLGTNGLLIGCFLLQLGIYMGLMDEHYFIASPAGRTAATVIYLLYMLLTVLILTVHLRTVRQGVRERRHRVYLHGISLLLLADLLGESFYCIMLFRDSPLLDRGLYEAFDLVSILFFLINLLTAVYIYRCGIRQVLTASPEQVRKQQEEERRTALAAAGLSEREIEVALLLIDGASYDEIADRLTISKYTVKRHAHNIYGKLDVANKVDLIGRFR